MEPNQSDWKRFRNSLEHWRERYLKRKNGEIRAILENNDLDETRKFWNIVDYQKKEAQILRNCLDNYKKSNMSLHMALMIKYGMIDREDLKEFSDELQDHLQEIVGI